MVGSFFIVDGPRFVLLCRSFLVSCSPFVYFSFVLLAQGNTSAKILLPEMSEILLPNFSSWFFLVSQLTFQSFIHFEFILVYGVKLMVWFHFSACTSLVLPAPFIKETVFTPLYALAPLCNSN